MEGNKISMLIIEQKRKKFKASSVFDLCFSLTFSREKWIFNLTSQKQKINQGTKQAKMMKKQIFTQNNKWDIRINQISWG